MKRFTLLNIAIFLLLALTTSAQNGTLRGVVYDDSNGETVPFATILVEETGSGTTTDLDGAYELSLAPGTYTLLFQYLGYADFTVSEVVFTADKVEVLDVRMKEEGTTLEEVVVTAKAVRTTEAALATLKKKSTNLLDGISSQTFAKLGDSNAGEALKRVTGVSVVGGKHVYVRGLGDRYTKTILNGMEIPGLDPDRNSFEMDLLPTNLIDNILVFKSFTPDLPGDFTGGVVDVITKDYPEDRFFNVSVGGGYNSDMHFQSNFVRQERSGTDIIGMDDGLRELKFNPTTRIPDPSQRDKVLSTLTSSFQDNAGVITGSNDLNKSISISTGNQLKRGDNKFSYLLSANYKNGSKFYNNAIYNTYIYDEQNFPNQYKLIQDRAIAGQVGEENVLWSGLVGLGYKRNNHKFSLQAMRLQNGISKAARQSDAQIISNSALLRREILEYAQREVTNLNVSGKHVSSSNKFSVSWKVSPTIIQVDEPDIRFSAFEDLGNGQYQLAPSVGAEVTRSWRNLKETNISAKVDLEVNLGTEDRDNKIKLGMLGSQKDRDFGINNFVFRAERQSDLNLNGEGGNVFNSDNIWQPESRRGVYVRGGFEPANTFEATQKLYAAYAMNEIELTEKFKAIYGVRGEQVTINYTGQNNNGSQVYNNDEVLNKFNILPSLNLVYALNDNSNFRASYNRTVARPSFKEKSVAQIQDRISGRTFIGNIDLQPTDIDNYDLRYETFAFGGQTLSVSAFFKRFANPIELESYDATAPNNFTPRNIAEQADVYGFEFESTRKLDFISESLKDFSVGANFTYVKSEVERSNAAELPAEERMRPMVGQAPYIINATAGYKGLDNGLEINASYNLQGKKLFIAGFGSISDVYIQPFNALNLKASKKIGEEGKYKFSLAVDNLLGDVREKSYEAFSGDAGIFESLNPGRTISFGFSANLR